MFCKAPIPAATASEFPFEKADGSPTKDANNRVFLELRVGNALAMKRMCLENSRQLATDVSALSMESVMRESWFIASGRNSRSIMLYKYAMLILYTECLCNIQLAGKSRQQTIAIAVFGAKPRPRSVAAFSQDGKIGNAFARLPHRRIWGSNRVTFERCACRGTRGEDQCCVPGAEQSHAVREYP
jgi:hypothetical protein